MAGEVGADGPARGSMDGKVVGRAINSRVRPLLKAAGFDQFAGRCAWRRSEYTIEHVVFRSFSAYIADGIGCTTFSFTGELGVFYRCFDPVKVRPREYELTFRATLGKTLRQPIFNPYGSGQLQDRSDVWYVTDDGLNLEEAVEDAAVCLASQGIPFMDRLREPAKAFDLLLTETSNDSYDNFGALSMLLLGRPGSPNWHETAAAIGGLVLDDPTEAIRTAPVLLKKV
ncbi:hypothetical protein GCM10009804_23030 [Kribbella hippodromi]|uniref:DUF4304 domain-containing protein n=1 Tax=Kribbella hippodromi TaxID=434347 RepID=A0ABP4NQF0_9ACTN